MRLRSLPGRSRSSVVAFLAERAIAEPAARQARRSHAPDDRRRVCRCKSREGPGPRTEARHAHPFCARARYEAVGCDPALGRMRRARRAPRTRRGRWWVTDRGTFRRGFSHSTAGSASIRPRRGIVKEQHGGLATRAIACAGAALPAGEDEDRARGGRQLERLGSSRCAASCRPWSPAIYPTAEVLATVNGG